VEQHDGVDGRQLRRCFGRGGREGRGSRALVEEGEKDELLGWEEVGQLGELGL
jgi:hypothetical protein